MTAGSHKKVHAYSKPSLLPSDTDYDPPTAKRRRVNCTLPSRQPELARDKLSAWPRHLLRKRELPRPCCALRRERDSHLMHPVMRYVNMGVTMKAKPIMTFREGAVGLSVWQRTSNAGTYYDFTLSRCYQGKDGEFSYSNSFHECNAEAMARVIEQAKAWIRQQRESLGDSPMTACEDPASVQEVAYE